MPQYKGSRAEQIAVGIGVCAAVCGTAYCLHKYILTPPSLLMAEETAKMDIEHQAIDIPVGFECLTTVCTYLFKFNFIYAT